ncbi:MAG: 2-hydroxycarboxylate transporter family protein [Steroidobacteraceae bacterium]
MKQATSETVGTVALAAEGSERTRAGPLRRVWWLLMERRIGIIPIPTYILLLVAIGYFVAARKIPTEVNVMIGVLALFGFTCGAIGNRVPVLRHIGGAAILATFLPSCLAYYHLIPQELVTAVTQFTKSTNFLYLFITAIIVGSVFGIDRTVLVRGFLRIFLPLAVGSVLAIVVGTAVGTLLGLGMRHALLFVVIPVMAGGVGEGAIPLSVGYASILHQPEGELFAQVLPSVMFASLTAILISGALNFIGRRRPELTGEGRLQPDEHDELDLHEGADVGHVDVGQLGAAALTAISLYLLGLVLQKVTGFPAPVAMLFLAVLLKLSGGVTPSLQQGAFVVYQFFAKAVTYPLLFAIGVAMTPWDKLIAALAMANLITIVATVGTLIGTGFWVGRRVKLYPIDAAIVNACHCGQGGTGAVAILTAAGRMQLMPFAQIATRIGGGITVTVTLIALARLG